MKTNFVQCLQNWVIWVVNLGTCWDMSQHYEAPLFAEYLRSADRICGHFGAILEPRNPSSIAGLFLVDLVGVCESMCPGKNKFEAIAPTPQLCSLETIFMKRLPCGNLR